ncbi:MAG: flagellar FliJ family protein [Hyphomonadaceae bacterium]
MKALKTLIRLAKEEVEIVRRALADAEGAHQRALQRIAALSTDIQREQEEALKAMSAWSTYGGYAAARAQDRRLLNDEERATADHALVLRARLAEAHVELKKLEKLAELRAAREAEGERKREQDALDEAAVLRAGRKRD